MCTKCGCFFNNTKIQLRAILRITIHKSIIKTAVIKTHTHTHTHTQNDNNNNNNNNEAPMATVKKEESSTDVAKTSTLQVAKIVDPLHS